jgi:trehalose 6-phosphate phosphatase
VDPFVARRPLLVVTDFDGTISPIVMDPWAARIVPGARRALRRLAGAPGVRVAVLSGRTAADVASRVRVGGATYLGNHGLEKGVLPRRAIAERLVVTHDQSLAGHAAAAERIAGAMPQAVPEEWLVVEHKVPAVAFHFRSAPDVQAAGNRVAAAIDRLDPHGGFVRIRGRRVIELRPPGAPGKGDALRGLIGEARAAAVIALGDDRSDAEAFDVLREARASGSIDGLALAVRARWDAVPDAAGSADAVLASPFEAAVFLRELARRVLTAAATGEDPDALRGASRATGSA